VSDLTALNVDTSLNPGGRYTITINEPTLASGTSVQDVLSKLQGSDSMGQVALTKVGWNWDVTFTYEGDGSDTVSDVFQEIATRLDAWYGSWDYVGAYASATGAADAHTRLNIPLPSSGWLWALVALVILIVFIASGGIGVARTVTRAAAS